MSRRARLTHLDKRGLPTMVDVSAKLETTRTAVAESVVRLPKNAAGALRAWMRRGRGLRKGDPLTVAVVAGIQAAKRTSELIPLCHPIRIESVQISPEFRGSCVRFVSTCVTTDRTGIEMEALVAAAAAALTCYDMLKSTDRGIVIERVRLLKKTGGKSGTFAARRR